MSLSFSYIDLLVVGVLLVSAGYAGYRGLVTETLSIFAWAAAAFATLWFGPSVTPVVENVITSPLAAMLAAYAIVFLVVLVPLSFLSFRFAQRVQTSQVGTLDRALGAAFGIVRGIAIVGFAYLILASFVKFNDQPEAVRTARTLPLMQASTEVILSLVPRRRSDDDSHVVVNNPEPGKVAPVEPAQQAPQTVPEKTTAAAKPAEKPHENSDITPTPKPEQQTAAKPSKKRQTSYGERDRRALDSLIETTGGNSTP
jgi:membrane protein required for colicin V production